MKVIILAGGRGTRLGYETELRPKPMVEIGNRPILWHIMTYYSGFGMNDFMIALGYKGEMIKRYMMEYTSLNSNLSLDLGSGKVTAHQPVALNWKVSLIDTGLTADTGSRLRKLAPYVDDGTLMMTYGDGLSNVDLKALLAFHSSHGRLATLTAVHPPARFGHLEFNGDRVVRFNEKPQTTEGWINGGFFVLERQVLDSIGPGDDVSFERDILPALSADGQLHAFHHDSFWQCMDTVRDKTILERLWESGDPPWKIW